MSDTGFSLVVANKNEVQEQVQQQFTLDEEQDKELLGQAETNVKAIFDMDMVDARNRRAMVGQFADFNVNSIKSVAKSNSLLQVRVGQISGSTDGKDEVGQNLMKLGRQIKDLDPSKIDFTNTAGLSKIFNPVKRYFDRFEKASTLIEGVVKSLEKSKRILTDDNVTLAREEQEMREKAEILNKEIQLARYMDSCIEQRIESGQVTDAEQIKMVQEQILFPLRQGIQDKQQMLLINQQGIVSLYMTQSLNDETIRGINRTQYLTVSALTSGAAVASALYNQRLAIEKIDLANQMVNVALDNSTALLKQQSAEIQRQAVTPAVSVEKFKSQFTELIDTIDTLSSFKQEALGEMKQNIDELGEISGMAQKAINQLEQKVPLNLSLSIS